MMTKLDYARRIHQVLYNMPDLPPEDHPMVVQRARNFHKEILKFQYEAALKAEQSVKDRKHASIPNFG